ncbi:hypothetical protein Microterr_25000 [Microbacterium terricola]|uniref:HNH nuclease domain-containing protein n=2 Tax=Microbacterium terricola TaxID=344163 RepID=A0ABM8E241_9MICO|nr:hypothetical protein Microterr_25000 [Microbacterium terricola]
MSEAIATIETMNDGARERVERATDDDDLARLAEFDQWVAEQALVDDEIAAYLDALAQPATVVSPALGVTLAMDEIERVAHRQREAIAAQYAAIGEVLADAREHPEFWLGSDPTLDPAWQDPRGRSVAAVRAERRQVAARAAICDIATRLHLAETTVSARGAHAATLQERLPGLWREFLSGAVDERNAVTAATLAATLPDVASDSWTLFDAHVTAMAGRLTPGKFLMNARAARERIHRESLQERHVRAAAERAVWLDPNLDGMATLTASLPAIEAHAAYRRVDQTARHLRGLPGETRTLAQLRADILADLLIDGETYPLPDDTAAAADTAAPASGRALVVTSCVPPHRRRKAQIAITIPVLSILGHSDEPATLDGYGPIPLETAKRLAGESASWIRVLTHPVSGTVLDLDRKTYRVPRALRRWLEAQHPVCIFPGCARAARDCDIDHRLEWARGGPTAAGNLGPECEPHHGVKTESLWRFDPRTGAVVWLSPTGREHALDPPPF